MIVTEELYLRYPDLDESRLSPLRSGIVNMRALADIARSLELGKYIRLGKGEEVTNGRDKNSLLADALEALIGAIYLDAGFATTATVVQGLIKQTLEEAMAKGAGLYGKTALQELVASLVKAHLNTPSLRAGQITINPSPQEQSLGEKRSLKARERASEKLNRLPPVVPTKN